MRVLGIDPGSETTGWGMLEGDGRRYVLVEYGAIKASPSEKFPARLLKICNGIEAVIAGVGLGSGKHRATPPRVCG